MITMKKLFLIFIILLTACEFKNNSSEIKLGSIDNYNFKNNIKISNYNTAILYAAKM